MTTNFTRAAHIATAAALMLAALPALASDRVAASTQAAAVPATTKPIAVQMYTLRDIPSLENRLKVVHDAGARAIETVGTQDVTAPELKALLQKYGIEVIASHVQLADLQKDPAAVVAFNRAIGNDVLVVPWLDAADRPKDAAGWTALGKELGAMATTLKTDGMTLAYHNHDFELVDFDGKTGLELLFDAAGPALKTELDLAWVARAGKDPAAMLATFGGRVFAVHAKDNAPEGQAKDEGGFATLGRGVLDWKTILPAAQAAGVQWYIVEHDNPTDPAAVVRDGAAYLESHLPAGAGR